VVGCGKGRANRVAFVTRLSRRKVLTIAAAGAGTLAFARVFPAAAQDRETHGISAFGDLKYPAEFPHFDYVNPDAPKGGLFSLVGTSRQYNQNFLTFNTMNSYILKGDAPLGMERTFASLMVSASDEPDSMYGLAARAVRVSGDGLIYTFLMRPGLTFHDGTPMTAQDCAFSLNLLKEKGHPIIQTLMREFDGAEATDDQTVVTRFNEKRGRDVPLFISAMPIFSRDYYSKRPFEESTLDVPLGSGPYKVGRFEAGRYIEYDRVKDWWGAKLPVQRGLHNFDVIRYEFYRDRDVAFEGFTGRSYTFREEFTSRLWATRYGFPAIRDGRVKRDVLKDETPSGAQGWFINTRRGHFKDPQLREALIYAFDFEWTNRTIMYGSYDRTHSVFQNSDMMASGKPEGDELKLLETYRGRVADEVFGEPFVPPTSDGSGQDRNLLRHASQLLTKAGYPVKDGRRVTPNGERISIEFLLEEPSFQPHHMPFIKNLGVLGISANLRLVDPVQMRSRINDFDFDITVQRFGFSTVPGDALRSYFSSRSADLKGSNNLAGISDPVIDELIDRVVAASTRTDMVTACRALDRVIRSGRYWIPHWYKASHWIAYWDMFDRPAQGKPKYARGIPETWWYDPAKAAQLERRG
jgi:microcin C transport system substrate-binding protein